jgi:hypothetical protein
MNDNDNNRFEAIKKLVNDHGYQFLFTVTFATNKLVSISKQDQEDGMVNLLMFIVKGAVKK